MAPRREIQARIARKRRQHRSTRQDLEALRDAVHAQLRAELAVRPTGRRCAADTAQLSLDLGPVPKPETR
ncbi:hypothetical protein [Azorhizobium caulinodans]|uniref:hypothetical protein n=1 Tax=Azorhizobium caulinodans TaxID=7 RepID=UPI002FBD3212